MTVDIHNLRGFDLETPLTSPGNGAPEIVCGSIAKVSGDSYEGAILEPSITLEKIEEYLKKGYILATAHGSFDLANVAQARPDLLAIIFQRLREGKHHDILIAQALSEIWHGRLGEMPNGSDLRNAEGKVTKRYSLYNTTGLVLGRWDAKINDIFRKSYNILKGIPIHRWPKVAKDYPIDDAVNQLEVAVGQLIGPPSNHAFYTVPGLPGQPPELEICRYCGEEEGRNSSTCTKAPRGEPHKNLGNLAAQCEAAFVAQLGACHGLRVDGRKLDILEQEASARAAKAVKRFQKKGWIRSDESEDTVAVKKAIAVAYGATGNCKRCGGTGRVAKIIEDECRGEKVKGRYQGCLGPRCGCNGAGKIKKVSGEVTCKNIFDQELLKRLIAEKKPIKDALLEAGCDGTGLDTFAINVMPRTDKLGIKTNRDAKTESGDEELAVYGEDEYQKSISTYIPYLRTGVNAPLSFSPNILVATGRMSYEGSPLHQMPRNGGERQCIRARGAWCGYPIETVLGSTDYEAGELDTLAQLTYWLFGYSQMREAINTHGKPGILHSDLASEVLGVPLEEFLVRYKAKDKTAVDFRQAMKPVAFGKGGAMGDAKLVLTARMKNAGFTVCENGPVLNEKKEPGYYGIRFCILTGGARRCGEEKVISWNDHECPPICKACIEIVNSTLTPAYFRRYPEVKDYHKWCKKQIKNGEPAPTLAWNADIGKPVIIRERGGLGEKDLPAFANNGFQSILSDILKRAYVTMTRECYLGVKDDGSPSPLAGCRVPLVVHDEPISELIRTSAHLSGPRIGQIMVQSGQEIAPDVTWMAQTALAEYWDKRMEPLLDSQGNLIVWMPPN